MPLYGLIGKNLTHSFSEKYFKNKFSALGLKDTQYNLFPLSNLVNMKEVISANPSLMGLNVTIPYKIDVLNYVDELDINAKEIGAVNTLKIKRSGDIIKIKGYNTDYLGFLKSLKLLDYKAHKNALILGTGGASKAVAYVLKLLNIDFLFVSRQPNDEVTINYNDINKELLSRYTLIINTTPLGMHPDVRSFPDIPYQHLDEKYLLFDLVYNPEKTVFLDKGLQQNAYICNGLNMLYAQAEYSWKIWNDETF